MIKYGRQCGFSELTGTPDPLPGIIGLNEMEGFIEKTTRCLLSFPQNRWRKHFDDPELRRIDELLDDHVLHELPAPEGFTPCMRTFYPSQCVRAERLKALPYPHMSYRNYCEDVINRLDSKRHRAFIHLPLHKGVRIDRTQLCHFRRGLSTTQLVNLSV